MFQLELFFQSQTFSATLLSILHESEQCAICKKGKAPLLVIKGSQATKPTGNTFFLRIAGSFIFSPQAAGFLKGSILWPLIFNILLMTSLMFLKFHTFAFADRNKFLVLWTKLMFAGWLISNS